MFTETAQGVLLAFDAEFSEFFASQYARLCWLGCALTGSPAQAEELAQEALVRTWWRWRLVGRPSDPASYVRRVLVNRHRSVLRRAVVEARSLTQFRPEELAVPAGDERAMVLWQAVQGLPVRQRVVLVLRFYEDRTEAEVAQAAGVVGGHGQVAFPPGSGPAAGAVGLGQPGPGRQRGGGTMSLERELRQLFGRIEDAPWPGEPEAFDQFLSRKRRRGRVLAAAAVAGVLVVVAVVGLLPALKSSTEPLGPQPVPGPPPPQSTAWFKATYVPRGYQLTRAIEEPPSAIGRGFLPTAQSFRLVKGDGEFTVSVNPYLQQLDIDRVVRTYPTVRVVQVRGHPGVLFPLPPDNQQGRHRPFERLILHNGLVWQERPGIVVQVLGSTGLPDQMLFEVAEGLRRIVVTRSGKVAITVGPRPPGWIRLARGGTSLDSMTVLPRSHSQQFSKPRENQATLVITETRDQYGPLRIPPQNIDATKESFASVHGHPTTLLHDPSNHKLTLIWREPGGIELQIEADEAIGHRQLLAIAEGLQQPQA